MDILGARRIVVIVGGGPPNVRAYGVYYTDTGYGWVWDSIEGFRILQNPDAADIYLVAISANGDYVAGAVADPVFDYSAAIWNKDVLSVLGSADNNEADGVSDDGLTVGGSGGGFALRWDSGVQTTIPHYLAYTDAYTSTIFKDGSKSVVINRRFDTGAAVATLWDGAAHTPVVMPVGKDTINIAFNAADSVSGAFRVIGIAGTGGIFALTAQVGFVWDGAGVAVTVFPTVGNISASRNGEWLVTNATIDSLDRWSSGTGLESLTTGFDQIQGGPAPFPDDAGNVYFSGRATGNLDTRIYKWDGTTVTELGTRPDDAFPFVLGVTAAGAVMGGKWIWTQAGGFYDIPELLGLDSFNNLIADV